MPPLQVAAAPAGGAVAMWALDGQTFKQAAAEFAIAQFRMLDSVLQAALASHPR